MTREVTRLPLDALWTEQGRLDAVPLRAVGRADIVQLLNAGPVRFVCADVGHALEWIPESDRFGFWKDEAKDRVVDPETDAFHPGAYPGGWCHLAREWRAAGWPPLIVLERHH